MECLGSNQWLAKFSSTDKVLLINPPVQEVRYAWIKWNQPTELLQLSTKLKQDIGCEIELLDFMLPSETGRVPIRDLSKKRIIGKENTVFRSRTYGLPLEEAKKRIESIEWRPTQIIISTLTTYWYESLITLIPYLKTLIPSAQVSVMGPYAVYETNHAQRINADFLVTDFVNLENVIPDFELYFGEKTKRLHNNKVVNFGGLKYTKENTVNNLIEQIKQLRQYNIRDYVIFEENLFVNDGTILREFIDRLDKDNLKVNLHGICGINLDYATDGIFEKMYKGGFKSFFVEYSTEGNELNFDSYKRLYKELVLNPNIKLNSGNLSGFLMIGTPNDDLVTLFKHSFNLLEICGSIIPKPYTPSIHTEDYNRISGMGRLELLSPHVFPLAEVSGITRHDYLDFYKHTTFLNGKRMGNSFDFFDNDYSSVSLKRSLAKKEGFK